MTDQTKQILKSLGDSVGPWTLLLMDGTAVTLECWLEGEGVKPLLKDLDITKPLLLGAVIPADARGMPLELWQQKYGMTVIESAMGAT